jgi:protein-disulfide isomerase
VVALPVVCLIAVAALWWQTRTELTAIRAEQRALAAALDDARGAAIIDVSGDPALGREDAVVTLIEFSDYECPFCVRHFTQTMPQIEAKYVRTGQIRYVFKDLPIDQLHPEAIRAHEATRCAAEQGKFWEMHTKMFSPAGTHLPAMLEARATEAGLALPAFRECVASGRATERVRADTAIAAKFGANGTPSFFVGLRDPETNRVRILQGISGAQPLSEFERVIDAVAAQQP